MRSDDILRLSAGVGKVGYFGKSLYGHPLAVASLGKRAPGGVLIVGAIHAREHITAKLLSALAAEYTGDYPIDVVPCLNPDGVILATEGPEAFSLKAADRLKLLRINDGSGDFSLWKANLRGVDLNTNFDAKWGQGEKNVRKPAPENYIGPAPGSEPETAAAMRLMSEGKYALVVAYHSKGEEVYWGFDDYKEYYDEARSVAAALGYALKRTPNSTGGLKDYWIDKYRLPGLTVEVGEDKYPHPYPEERLPELIIRHRGIFDLYAEIAKKVWTDKSKST